jgi:hypothetical protein
VGYGLSSGYGPGDRVVMQHAFGSGMPTQLTVSERATFGTPADIGPNTEYAFTYTDLSDTSRGGVLYGATTQAVTSPTSTLASYANIAAPSIRLSLGSGITTRVGNLVGTRVWLVDQN